jgi:RNA polymerase sigma-70 factor, ECF subfamily
VGDRSGDKDAVLVEPIAGPTGAHLANTRMAAIYDTHAKPLYRFLLRLTLGDEETAEDLLQETFLRAWRHLDRLSKVVEEVRPWLFTVARRVAIDAARAKRIRPAEVGAIDLALLPSGDDPIERFVSVHDVRAALRSLSADHRRVLAEVYVRQRTTQEAAEILGIPEGTVKSRTHNALRALRVALRIGEDEPAPGRGRRTGVHARRGETRR